MFGTDLRPGDLLVSHDGSEFLYDEMVLPTLKIHLR